MMDFEDAKENIQPLAAGRNASILQASLRLESPQELLAQRRELEQAIREYSGNDPLEPWYAYISWIEQSFPSGGKESGLEEVLTKCLSAFENEERYFQDRRMIKLYMKFVSILIIIYDKKKRNPKIIYCRLIAINIRWNATNNYSMQELVQWWLIFIFAGRTIMIYVVIRAKLMKFFVEVLHVAHSLWKNYKKLINILASLLHNV